MPASEQLQSASTDLSRLSVRAKQVEDHVAAAKTTAKQELETMVGNARTAVDDGTEKLQAEVQQTEGKVAERWGEVQHSWKHRVAKARKYRDDHRHEHDVKKAARRADDAELDAVLATSFAYAALEEAEYAGLDAALARLEANELEAAG